jgi:hypothetical protein
MANQEQQQDTGNEPPGCQQPLQPVGPLGVGYRLGYVHVSLLVLVVLRTRFALAIAPQRKLCVGATSPHRIPFKPGGHTLAADHVGIPESGDVRSGCVSGPSAWSTLR